MLRLATYNIRRGGLRRGRLIGEVLGSLDPDLVVLQEAVDPRVVHQVAEMTGARVLSASLGRSVAVLSRMGDLEIRWHRPAGGPGLIEVELPSIGARLIGTHLAAGLSGRGERRRTREIEHVLSAAREGPGLPRVVVAGDLNAIAPGDLPGMGRLPAWIRILLRVDGGISTVAMQRLLEAGFTDAFRHLNPSSRGATIPSGAPSVRLDYFLVGSALLPGVVACTVGQVDPVLLAAASDHLPLVLELEPERLPPRPAITQEDVDGGTG
jgi:hypothetical protein